jgi:hypothetical protein
MSAITDIYDYFTPIETAVQSVFAAAEVAACTPVDDPDFQRPRPRVEIELSPGDAQGRLRYEADRLVASGNLRETAYSASLSIRVITEAQISQHRAFLARAQYQMDNIVPTIGAAGTLTNHRLASAKATGGSVSYTPQDGCYVSELTYDIDFSILPSAWAALET